MALDRACSIVFYLVIAATTGLMASRVSAGGAKAPVFVNGERTRQSFWNRLFLTGIFAILFLCAALRFDVGNDYQQYTQTAHEAYVGGYVVTEIGFNRLVRLVYTLLGGEYYEAVFAIFSFATIWVFLRALYRQSVSFTQSFFLFMTLGLYFQTYNTMRYYFALALALCAMRSVLAKDYLRFVFWILIAALFHKSVLLVIPAYWLATLEWRRGYIVCGLALSALCFLGRDWVLKAALVLYPSYRDTVYLEGGGSIGSAVRILSALAFYLWLAHTMGTERLKAHRAYRELRFYMQLQLLALVSCTLFSFLPVVTRITYYFSVAQLLMIPLMLGMTEEERLRRRVRAIVFFVCVVNFGLFLLQAHEAGVGLLPYKSWLFTEERYVYK
ncbi:MAG: EpsG family protein [Roseburia sp.]|nr:EpsG family protein [Roseburia sp.]